MKLQIQVAIISLILLGGVIFADRHGEVDASPYVVTLLLVQVALIWISSWRLYRRVRFLAPDSRLRYLDAVPRRRYARIAEFNRTAEGLLEATQDPVLSRQLHLRKLQGAVLVVTVLGLVLFSVIRYGWMNT